MTRRVRLIDPLTDAGWEDLVRQHPRASAFHLRGWLEALRETYGYCPIVLATGRGPLQNGVVFCEVRSWASRPRLVSLPFSDHCEPLVDDPDALRAILDFVEGEMANGRWRSIEVRPTTTVPKGMSEGSAYFRHTLDLAKPEDRLFAAFHPSSIRRAVRRAEREGLCYEAGRSEELLSAFYALLGRARRRHGVPPQPLDWFRNLVARLPGELAIHAARKDGVVVAAILTLTFRNTILYKYGGSDERFHRLGGMPFLFWRVIRNARAQGLERLDLGRSDLHQTGLVTFKERLGAARSGLTYYAHPARRPGTALHGIRRAARPILAHLPVPALNFTGRLFYRHLG